MRNHNNQPQQYSSYQQIHLPQRPQPQPTAKESEYFPNRRPQAPRTQPDPSESSTTIYSPSNSSRSTRKPPPLLSRDLEQLSKQLARCQQQLREKEDQAFGAKKLEAELVETYRVIHYYQGKAKQLQKQCKRYEWTLNNQPNKQKAQKLAEIIEEMRNDNCELQGQLEKKNYQIEQLSIKLSATESKYHSAEQKNNQFSRKPSVRSEDNKRGRAMDGYARDNLLVQARPPHKNDSFVKRRPTLSRSKNARRARGSLSGESESEQSNAGSQYKNSVYIRRKLGSSKTKLLNSQSNKSINASSRAQITAVANLNSRLNHIQNELLSLQKQNEKLHKQEQARCKQLEQLISTNEQLAEQNHKLKAVKVQAAPPTRKQQSASSGSTSTDKPAHNSSKSQLSMFVSNVSNSSKVSQSSLQSSSSNRPEKQAAKSGYKFKQVRPQTVRKMTYNLVRQSVTYFQMVEQLAEAWTSSQQLPLSQFSQSPYNLEPSQIDQLERQRKLVMRHLQGTQQAHRDLNEEQHRNHLVAETKSILRDNIPFFKNITIRRDYTLNIQIANKFKNYEEQIGELSKKYGNRMPYQVCQEQLVKKWGMSSEEFLLLMVRNFEENGQVGWVEFAKMAEYFLLE